MISHPGGATSCRDRQYGSLFSGLPAASNDICSAPAFRGTDSRLTPATAPHCDLRPEWIPGTAIHAAEFIADSPYLADTRMKVLTGRNEFRRLRKYPGTSEHFEKLRPILKPSGAVLGSPCTEYVQKFSYFLCSPSVMTGEPVASNRSTVSRTAAS